ncbi:MAG: hypothetical protein ACRD2J_04225 [Thermoanaerobaculia bacterium]
MSDTAGFLFPVAAITLMLWILWSDSVRPRPMPRAWYVFRAVLYLAMAGVMAFNGWRYARAFRTGNWVLLGTAMAIGLIGVVYFGRKAFRKGT